MKTSELADYLLLRLYEKAEEEGHEKVYYLYELAKDVDVSDRMKITNAAGILQSRHFLNIYNQTIGGGPRANISGEGCLYVERGGETGVIEAYQQNPEAFIVNIDQSTKIHGDIVQSNISSHTKVATQNVSIDNDIHEIISEMIIALKNDNSILPPNKEDLMLDIETLKTQIAKNEKNKELIGSLLDSLSKVASISSFAMQLYRLFA